MLARPIASAHRSRCFYLYFLALGGHSTRKIARIDAWLASPRQGSWKKLYERQEAIERIPMCGITGFVHNGDRPVDRDILSRMSSAIFHRGPDDDGFYVHENIGLAMRRLSIID